MPHRFSTSNGSRPGNGCLDRPGQRPHRRGERKPAEPRLAGDVYALVIGPDDGLCAAVGGALEGHGLVTATASALPVAEALLEERAFNVIVLDCAAGGPRVEPVREHQPDAGLVVLTDAPSYEGALACLRARVSDCLAKPVEVADVWRAVERCLRELRLLRLADELLFEALGAVLRRRRKALGLTLHELSRRAGLSLGYLSQVELGKNAASVVVLHRMTSALGMTLAELFEGALPST
ncbi:MAG TPA: helix-turn-helix domain-containing protein [Gemmataceae bacterium]|nr:helix-turn-helix domain-containing protein [Gemmataceae bacterium]